MSFYASRSPRSFQTGTVLVIKFLMWEGGIYGKVMMADGVVKRNTGGRTEVVRVCGSEDERVDALRAYFGISLTPEERLGIRGRDVELGTQAAGQKNSWL